MRSLGQHVKWRRSEVHIPTQAALAEKLGWHPSYVSHIERDRGKRPSFPLLVQLATALGETVDDLLEDTGLREKYASELGLPPTSTGSKLLVGYIQANFPDLTEDEAQQAMDTLAGVFRRRQPRPRGDQPHEDARHDAGSA